MPSFNHPGAHPPARCAGHREPGMVNVRHRTCRQVGCTTEVRALSCFLLTTWLGCGMAGYA